MIRQFLVWLQNDLGKGGGDIAQSWSETLLGSLNFWGILEGTHLLVLMLFAGTILFVDLRLLGFIFVKTPVSVIEKKLLPFTISGFVLMVITGLALFFSKPLFYYHNVWFRAKIILLALAVLNIALFHFWIQRGQGAWDTAAKPPLSARASAFASLTFWLLIVMMGRLIAYSWYECGKPQPDFINIVQSCASSDEGAMSLEAK